MSREREGKAREVLARAYEAATDAPFKAGQRFHAANVRVMDKRDYTDWKDRAAIAAMLEFADRPLADLEAVREAAAKVAETLKHGSIYYVDGRPSAAIIVGGHHIAAAIRSMTIDIKGEKG